MTGKGVLPANTGERAGMLLNLLYRTALEHRIVQPERSTELRLRNTDSPALMAREVLDVPGSGATGLG